MDSITQVLLGSAVAAGVAPQGYRKRAILTGAVLGTLPDLDVFMHYASDVDNFTHHRGFSHSLLLLPIVALVLLPLLRRFYRAITWGRLYLLIVLPLVTHPMLDALTAYGTQLFYPIGVSPTFFASIFIIDPLYSLWLLAGVILYLFSPRLRWANSAALIISTLYLGLGIGLQSLAKAELAKAYPQTKADQWFVGALTASPLCWHGVYKDEAHYIETAFNVLNPGEMAAQQYSILPPSAYPASADWARLQWFNPNTVLRRRGQQLISSDLRMGEFGFYPFEFIIAPERDSGQRIPLSTDSVFTEKRWQADSVNAAAKRYAARNNEPSFPKYKWSQFMRCLTGGS
ncbi:MAG: hydrolase [Gammaproteobacteria bacterium]|nr:MAG: hydrolase [Gammaproteobacteria bacterium]